MSDTDHVADAQPSTESGFLGVGVETQANAMATAPATEASAPNKPGLDRATTRPKVDGAAIAGLIIALLGGVIVSLICAGVAHSRINQGKRRGRGLVYTVYAINVIWLILIIVVSVGTG